MLTVLVRKIKINVAELNIAWIHLSTCFFVTILHSYIVAERLWPIVSDVDF